ncbi:MAG: hypothetical protein HOP29_20145 [Phycisphaerales bacterium]|nr:hypothetical protein [Phycisphaerales bacterium]
MVGCAAPKPKAVAVRFAPAPDQAWDAGRAGVQMASSTPYDHAGGEYVADCAAAAPFEDYTVTLWGGNFAGQDVTWSNAQLTPGNYTFGFWNHDQVAAMKGWVNVNFAGTGLLDTLHRWKNQIPQQKKWLAYDHELTWKLRYKDAAVFKGFARQLRALDKLEREIDHAIRQEMAMQKDRAQQYGQMMDDSVVLMLPTGSGMFHPTTQPVFDAEELHRVQAGEPVTKFMLVADAQDTRQKLSLVDQMCHSLTGCREVLTEEVDRLERHKRYLIITDHMYNHDRKFVENEMQLQQALNAIDQLNEQINDMRERRLALSFINGLVSPDSFMDPLTEETRDLEQERTVLETQKNRLNTMFDHAPADSHYSVALQRQRQRAIRAIEDINAVIEGIGGARVALTNMKDNTRVIHRQGNLTLMAACFVDSTVPSYVREAVEQDAMMTVRLEASPTGFESVPGGPATARTVSSHAAP